jgi:hypothetical protein
MAIQKNPSGLPLQRDLIFMALPSQLVHHCHFSPQALHIRIPFCTESKSDGGLRGQLIWKQPVCLDRSQSEGILFHFLHLPTEDPLPEKPASCQLSRIHSFSGPEHALKCIMRPDVLREVRAGVLHAARQDQIILIGRQHVIQVFERRNKHSTR